MMNPWHLIAARREMSTTLLASFIAAFTAMPASARAGDELALSSDQWSPPLALAPVESIDVVSAALLPDDPIPPGADDYVMAQAEQSAAEPAPAAGESAPGQQPRGSWRLPPIVVEGTAESLLREEQRIGSYGQPRWTAHRRFPTTRIYVRPQGTIETEYWLRLKLPRGGKPQYEHRQEVEVGLPHRFQFDFYLIESHEGNGHVFVDQSFELRYALADWGVLPGNPTFYFEYVNRTESRPDKIEMKGLFGGEIAPRWHWGTNLIWEHELGGGRENVFELTTAVAYSLIDEKLSLGLEGKFEVANEAGNRSGWAEDLRLGPTLQWRPLPQMHVDVAPLVGLNGNSSRLDLFLVVGWEF